MSRPRVVGLSLVVCLIRFAGTSFADGPPSHVATQLSFADSLMLQKRYREAELEYERLAFDNRENPPLSEMVNRMLNAALVSGDARFTLTLARTWESRTQGAPRCEAENYEGRALYRLGNYTGVLALPRDPLCGKPWDASTRYGRGLSLLRLRRWDDAATEFQALPPDADLHAAAQAAAARASEGKALIVKSPALAAGISLVLPGAGYFYAGHPQTAIAALAVNGVFIGGTYSAVHAGQLGVAALLALFSFGWYSGAIYGSAEAAQRENAFRLDRFVRPLEIRW